MQVLWSPGQLNAGTVQPINVGVAGTIELANYSPWFLVLATTAGAANTTDAPEIVTIVPPWKLKRRPIPATIGNTTLYAKLQQALSGNARDQGTMTALPPVYAELYIEAYPPWEQDLIGGNVAGFPGANLAVTIPSGTTVDVGTLSGDVSIAPGATVDVGTISGAVTLSSGTTVDISGQTVDISGQDVIVDSISSTVTVSGAVTILSIEDFVTTFPSLQRTAGVDVTVVSAGATASLGLSPNTIFQLTVMSSSSGSTGTLRLQNSAGPWLATCPINGSAHVDWNFSGFANGGNVLEIYNGSADTITAGVAIEYT